MKQKQSRTYRLSVWCDETVPVSSFAGSRPLGFESLWSEVMRMRATLRYFHSLHSILLVWKQCAFLFSLYLAFWTDTSESPRFSGKNTKIFIEKKNIPAINSHRHIQSLDRADCKSLFEWKRIRIQRNPSLSHLK